MSRSRIWSAPNSVRNELRSLQVYPSQIPCCRSTNTAPNSAWAPQRQLTSTQKNSGTGTPGLLSIPCPQSIAHSDAGSHTKAKGHLGISNQKSQLIKGGGGPDANAVGSNHMETSDRLYNLGSREGSYCIQAVWLKTICSTALRPNFVTSKQCGSFPHPIEP